MGQSTVMFVQTDTSNFLEIMPKVVSTLNKWQRELLDKESKKLGFSDRFSLLRRDCDFVGWTNGISNIRTYDFRSFNIEFTLCGEVRDLFVTPTCSTDYSDTAKGDKIIFSLGYWGMSEEIMMSFSKTLQEYGDVYYTPNDCDEEFKKLDNGLI